MRCKSLKRNGLIEGNVVYRNPQDGLFYTYISGVNNEMEPYTLISPTENNPNVFSFIPECPDDHDAWDESLGIIGKDCEVWLNRRWNVLDINKNKKIINLNYYLCKWSQALAKERYSSIVTNTVNLEEQGYFDIVKPEKKKRR